MKCKAYPVYFLAAVLMITIVAGVAGCGQSAKPTTEGQPPMTTLKIGLLPTEDTMPVLVAAKEGYFTAENLDVEVIPFQSPVESQSAFQSGGIDGMVTDMIVAALLKSAGEDLRITSIAFGATPQEGPFAIIAAPQSTVKTVADLKGKSIGISANSIIEYVTDGLLTAGGVDPAEVNKVTVAKIPLRVEMLLNNKIDAITVPEPQISYVTAEGARVIAEDTKGDNLSQSVIIMTGKTLNEKHDAVIRFFKAYTKAVNAINNQPEQYRDLFIENMNIPANIAAKYKVQHYPLPQLPAEQDVNRVLTWLDNKQLLKNEVTYGDFLQQGLY
ncbi:MAG: MetQ/NlpA family ABC transporter substrate-binding protein [Firmicutes bacterium]|nr:MetQ/NlpA family ABC transporter substrate-binding protein [Bacillota bacterium]